MKVPTAVIMVHVVMMENVCAMLDISEATAQVNYFFKTKTYLDIDSCRFHINHMICQNFIPLIGVQTGEQIL